MRTGTIDASRERVHSLYGAAIGRSRDEIVTPALVLDIDAAQRNIDHMAARLRDMPAGLRPHIKVHKSPDLALRQMAAGAFGLSTATVWEALVMSEAGVDDLFIVNTIAGREKIDATAALAGEVNLRVAVDSVVNARALSAAALRAGSTIGVMIEIDTGMDRAGLDDPDSAAELARGIVDLPALRFDGLTGYEGHCALTPDAELRHHKQRAAIGFLVSVADAIAAVGIPVHVLSAGGTATWEWTASDRRITEIQAGTYCVVDNFHGHMAPEFEHSLTVQTTVISRPDRRVITDAGSKSVGDGELSTAVGHPELHAVRFDEEHGVFAAPADSSLRIGDSVALIPGYSPSTVNWYDAYHVIRDDMVVDIWPVIPRGPGHNGLLPGASG